MGWWNDRALPHLVERSCGMPELEQWRAAACEGLSGTVLEIGFGSGLNLPHLSRTVTDVVAVEPSDEAWRISAPRRARCLAAVRRSGLDGERIAEADASCDGALATFTLCTVPEPLRALAEVRRVLRPGGTLRVLEHGLAPDPGVARWQRRLEPVQRRVAGGCHLTRDTPTLLAEAGLEVLGLEQRYLPGPAVGRPWTYLTLATAAPRP